MEMMVALAVAVVLGPTVALVEVDTPAVVAAEITIVAVLLPPVVVAVVPTTPAPISKQVLDSILVTVRL